MGSNISSSRLAARQFCALLVSSSWEHDRDTACNACESRVVVIRRRAPISIFGINITQPVSYRVYVGHDRRVSPVRASSRVQTSAGEGQGETVTRRFSVRRNKKKKKTVHILHIRACIRWNTRQRSYYHTHSRRARIWHERYLHY